jgi:hypothetical protein
VEKQVYYILMGQWKHIQRKGNICRKFKRAGKDQISSDRAATAAR